MTIEIETFEAISTTTQFVQEQTRDAADFWFVRTVDLTPRLTGFASSNWVVTFGSSTNRLLNVRRVKNRKYNRARGDLIQTWTVGRGNIYLSNNTPYINFLEAGRSPQARSGMLGIAAVATDARFGTISTGTTRLPIVGTVDVRELEAGIEAADGLLDQIDDEDLAGNFRNVRRAKPFGGRFAQGIVTFDSSIRNVTASLFSFKNILVGFGIVQLGRGILDRVIEFERAERVFGIVLDSQDEVDQALGFAADEAERLGADTLSLTLRFADFLTAAESTDINAAEVFSDLAGSFNNLGVSVQDFDGAFLGVIQILSRGIVSTEDLRQISDRVPGALAAAQDAARSMGGNLSEMLADGALIAEDFLPLFAEELSQRIGVEATEAVEGTGQDLQRFRDDLVQLSTKFVDAETRSQITTAVERFRDVIKNPGFQEIAVEIGAFVGQGLSLIASNLPEIGTALAALAAIKLGGALIAAGRVIGLAIRAFTSLNPLGLLVNVVQLLAVGILIATDTGIGDIIAGARIGIDFIINAVVAIGRTTVSAFEAIPTVVQEVFFDLVEGIAGLFEDLANGIIDGLNVAGQLIGRTIDPVNLGLDRTEADLGQIGRDIGRDIGETFEQRWARPDPADSFEQVEREAIPDLIDISRGYDEAAGSFEDIRTSAREIEPAITKVDSTLGSSFASFLTGTENTFDEVLDLGSITFEPGRAPGRETFETAETRASQLVDTSELGFGVLGDLAGDVFLEGAQTVTDAAGVELELVEGAFALGSELLGIFGEDLEGAVGIAQDIMLAFSEFLGGEFDVLGSFLTGAWNAFFGFFGETHVALDALYTVASASETESSAGAVSDSGSFWAAASDVIDATSGFVTQAHAQTNAGHAAQSGELVGGATTQTRVFEGDFLGTTAASAREFGSFVGNAASQFAGFIRTANQAGAEAAAIGQAALSGTGNVLAQLDRTTGLATTISLLTGTTGGGPGPGIPQTGTLPTVSDLEALRDLTPAERLGANIAKTFGNFLPFEAAVGLATGTVAAAVLGPGAIAAGVTGLAVLGADFIVDTVFSGVGAFVGRQLDELTGGRASAVIGTIESGLRAIADATGISFVQRQVDRARDFLSDTASIGLSTIRNSVRDFFGFERENDRASDRQQTTFSDRTSQPGGIGGFAAGGVLRALGLKDARPSLEPNLLFLDLVREPSGKLVVSVPEPEPEPAPQRRVVANFEGADPFAVERFREWTRERGWRLQIDPAQVRRVIGNLALEAA